MLHNITCFAELRERAIAFAPKGNRTCTKGQMFLHQGTIPMSLHLDDIEPLAGFRRARKPKPKCQTFDKTSSS
jgi:hypothetical protein